MASALTKSSENAAPVRRHSLLGILACLSCLLFVLLDLLENRADNWLSKTFPGRKDVDIDVLNPGLLIHFLYVGVRVGSGYFAAFLTVAAAIHWAIKRQRFKSLFPALAILLGALALVYLALSG